MKQKRASNMERSMRNAPVLLPRLLLLGDGATSACVTAISLQQWRSMDFMIKLFLHVLELLGTKVA